MGGQLDELLASLATRCNVSLVLTIFALRYCIFV